MFLAGRVLRKIALCPKQAIAVLSQKPWIGKNDIKDNCFSLLLQLDKYPSISVEGYLLNKSHLFK
jgi:hypothetical protein